MATHAPPPDLSRYNSSVDGPVAARNVRRSTRWWAVLALGASIQTPMSGAETLDISAPQLRVEFALTAERQAAFREALQALAVAEQLRLMQGTTLRITGAVPTWTLIGAELTLDLASRSSVDPGTDEQPMLAVLFCTTCTRWTNENSPLLALLSQYSSTTPKVQPQTETGVADEYRL
jgi:hypothetical protein